MPRKLKIALTPLVALALAAGLSTPVAGEASPRPERQLSLAQAIAWALEANEGILIERTGVAAADAGESAARGAYDPLLAVETSWSETTPPVNSAFSGAPGSALAPTQEVAETAVALRQLLPTGGELSLSAGAARTSSNAAFDLLSPAWDSRFGVALRQPLLQGRPIDTARAGLRVAAADRRIAAASLRRVVIETVAAVERTYWTLVAARGEVEVQIEAVELADEQLADTLLRIESGAAPEAEEAQPRAELERRRGDLLAARERAERAQTALLELTLGDDDDALWSARLIPTEAMEMNRTEVDRERAMREALASRVELAAARSLVERRIVETELADDGADPSLDLVVSYDRFGLAGDRNPAAVGIPGLPSDVPSALEGGVADSFSSIGEGEFDDARVGLIFSLPIGRTSARAQAEIATLARRRAEIELQRAKKAIRVEVLDAAAALDTAAGRIDAARAGREAAQVQLAAERDRYEVGLSINFLVLTRQNDLARARLAEIAALTDYRIADTAWRRAIGTLLEDRSIDVRVADEG